jgi:hypothetical protein
MPGLSLAGQEETRCYCKANAIVEACASRRRANFEPQIAIHVADKQPYHNIPAHLTQFERLPPM